MSFYLERFGTAVIPLYEGVHDTGTFASALPSVATTRGEQYDLLGTEQARPAPATITVRGEILASDASDKTTQTRIWQRARGTRARLVRREAGTDQRHWVWARLNRVAMQTTPDTTLIQPFTLEFKVYSACWQGRRRGSGWVLDSGVDLDIDYWLDMSDRTALTPNGLTTLTLTNSGDTPIANAILTIANPAAGTAITAIAITAGPDASTVKASWTYSATVAANTSLVIDCGAASITNNGANDYAHFDTTAGVIDDWIAVYAGSTTVKITLTGGGSGGNAATVTVDYHEGWQ